MRENRKSEIYESKEKIELSESTLIPDSYFDEYTPIQKNQKLFKYILYSTKIEILFNSLINMIYYTSHFEILLWLVGFLIFTCSPKNLFTIWILIFHVAKGVIGFLMLRYMPNTYTIIEEVAKDKTVDDDNIIEKIKTQIHTSFLAAWEEKKKFFFFYFVLVIVCVIFDFITMCCQIAFYGGEGWNLMKVVLIIISIVYVLSDLAYFLWLISLSLFLPKELIQPVMKALMGSVQDLARYGVKKLLRRE